jgi:vacuolar-type H+-ATPase catalytic subunit A/Vma1
MRTPKTTELTLKTIVENLKNIPSEGFSQETHKLSTEQKRKLMNMAATFEQFGEVLGKEESIMKSAKALSEFSSLAESYAVNECADWFQQEIVKKDMKSMKQKVMEYQKHAQQCFANMQQLGVLYEDIKHVAGRYYDLKTIQEAMPALNGSPAATTLE